MANPNKTVGKFARAWPKTETAPDPFFAWFFEQVQQHGRTFASMDEARREWDQVAAKDRDAE
jgi:hypothetical protein